MNRTEVTTAVRAEGQKERIAAILGHAEAQGRRALAEKLAFETDMSPEACAGILASTPKEAAAHGLPGSPATIANAANVDHEALWRRVIERANAPIRARKA